MGTKNNPGKFDCYKNAEPDEPMFVLLGRDKHASALVWLWAALRELEGEGSEKVSEARECSTAMVLWQAERERPIAGLGDAIIAGVLEFIRVSYHTIGEKAGGKETSEALAVLLFGKAQLAKTDPVNSKGEDV